MEPTNIEILNVEEKIKYIENLVNKENRTRVQIFHELKNRKVDRGNIIKHLKHQRRNRGYFERDSIYYLQQALDEHNGVDHFEHVIKIKRLFHRLQCGRNSLAEEKRILNEIKCTQQQYKKLCVDGGAQKWVPWNLQEVIKSKDSIKDHMKHLFQEMPEIWKEQKAEKLKAEQLQKELQKGLEDAERDISSLQIKLDNIDRERAKLYAYILELKRS